MPIYEFYCEDCNTIFNFFSRVVNTTKRPTCPSCKREKLDKCISRFATLSGDRTEDDMDMPFDESKMEQAMNLLGGEMDNINEDDPRQAAQLMRKFSDITGMQMGSGMEEALQRLEAGEDPDQIEADMGDVLENEEPFFPGQAKPSKGKKSKPRHDTKLYEL